MLAHSHTVGRPASKASRDSSAASRKKSGAEMMTNASERAVHTGERCDIVFPRLVGIKHIGLEPKLSGHALSLLGAFRMARRAAGKDRDTARRRHKLVQQRRTLLIHLGCQHCDTGRAATGPGEAVGQSNHDRHCEKRPADVIGAAVMVAKIATGEIEEKPKAAGRSKGGKVGGAARARQLSGEAAGRYRQKGRISTMVNGILQASP